MAEVDIGIGKTARRAYRLDDVSIVPSRRTRDPEDVDVACEIDAYRFEMPILGAPTDSVVSPATAVELGRLGSAGVLHLEGLWTRYEHPEKFFEEIAELPAATATRRMQEIYAEPVKPELIGPRIAEIKDTGVTCAVAITPHRTLQLADAVLQAEPDLLVTQATIVSAEHVARTAEPLNLKAFIRHYELPVLVGGCTSYQAALHLMRTGAAGVLVGAGSGAGAVTREVLGVGVPLATGGVPTGGDIAKAVACGADAAMIGTPLAAAAEAPGRGWHWGMGAVHASLPRGERVRVEPRGTLEQILRGPAHDATGGINLTGALRRSMALCGYESVKDLQKADLVVIGEGAS